MRNRFILLVMVLLCAAVMLAQVDTGAISGTVRDPQGAVVPNASVSAKNLANGGQRTAKTNSQGNYSLLSLMPGDYELKITAQNFSPVTKKLELNVGAHFTADATLTLSAAATTVEVAGGAASVEVNTQNEELSQVITPNQMANLPSLNRNPYDFVATAGNVSSGDRMGSASDQNTGTRGVGFIINGQRSSGTEILLDGAENVDLFSATVGQNVITDTVQEYRIITNNFGAEYGRASGGVVNLITKSGTNAFHGSAWEYNRVSALTANTYNDDAYDVPKGIYTRNQFGYTVGGPIIKDKLFFYQSTEFLRVRSEASQLSWVPTPEFLAGAPPTVQSYFNAYGGGVSNQFIQTSDQLKTPIVTSKGVPVFGLVNFQAPQDAGGGSPQNTHNIFGRADYIVNDKTQMFVRVNWTDEVDLSGAAFSSPYQQYNVGSEEYGRGFMWNVTHTFTPNFLSSTKLSYSRIQASDTYNTTLQNTPTLYLTNSAAIGSNAVQLPGFFDNQTGTGGLPYGGPQNITQINQDLSWVKGAHTIKMGGQLNYQQMNRAYGAYAQAIEELGSLNNLESTGNLTLFQAAIDPQGETPCSKDASGNIIQTASCTLTLPVSSPSFARSYRYRDFALYLQDSFKFKPRLTLNYGMRYEYYGVQHDSIPSLDSNLYLGAGSNFFQQLANAQMELAPNSPIGKLWNPNYGTVAPRVGFAYDVFGDGKTSLRGGFGISYERNFGNVTFNMIQNPPNYASVQLTGSQAGSVTTSNLGPFSGANGTVALSPSSPRYVNQNIDTAQTQMWSLTLERQLARNTTLGVDYDGAHGVHLYDISNVNMLGSGQAYLGESEACVGCFTRVNQQWSSINMRGSGGTSHYNAMNVHLQSNNLHNSGVSLVANYTWAHSLDDLSSAFSESAGAANGVGNLGYLDPRNPMLDYGSSDYDIRHRFVASAIWDAPFFKSSHGLLKQVASGWSAVPQFTARTGTPFSIMDSTNTLSSNSGVPSGIPRYTPDGAISSYAVNTSTAISANNFALLTLPAANSNCQSNWMVTSSGCVETFGPFPTNMTARNAFRGPGAWNADFSVGKKFPVTERVALTFRAEMFNLFNHHNMYVNEYVNDVSAAAGVMNTNAAGQPVVVGAKGGLGSLAGSSIVTGNPTDERRFIQLSLRASF